MDDERAADSKVGPDLSGYLDYLRANREFSAPAVAAAIDWLGQLAPRRISRALDAGTGAGGAIPALRELVEHGQGGGLVTAIDSDERAIAVASEHRSSSGSPTTVDVRLADMREVAETAAGTDEAFDLIWAADAVWPGTFEDPAAVVSTLAGALARGGTLALFTTSYYQSMLLPGHSRLERLIRTASELTWGLPSDGPSHYERQDAWLRLAGLTRIAVRAFPVAARLDDAAARAYLERVAWPEMRHAARANGRAVGMTSADVGLAEALLDPASARYVGADPDGYVVQPSLCWVGVAPGRE